MNLLRRWYNFRFGTCLPKESVLYGKIKIVCGERLVVGKRVSVNSDVIINAMGGVTIGDDVVISDRCLIYSANYKYRDSMMGDEVNDHVLRPVKINSKVWLGAGTIVLPGVEIGGGCVIGAGSVVTKDCVPFGLYAGNPAKLIKKLGQI